jgi:hypothetical protein
MKLSQLVIYRNFKEPVDTSQQDRIVVTGRGKPAAALVAVEGSDSEGAMSVASASRERDLRLDFFRGLALFCIFIDHIPDNILAQFTLQSAIPPVWSTVAPWSARVSL